MKVLLVGLMALVATGASKKLVNSLYDNLRSNIWNKEGGQKDGWHFPMYKELKSPREVQMIGIPLIGVDRLLPSPHHRRTIMMHGRRNHLTYALGTLVIAVSLVLTPSAGAENSTTIDSSTQPTLKSWSNIIPNSNRRFIVLADFSNQAVLDRETGLVWEKAPDVTPAADWVGAKANCLDKSIAGRKGWRLPSIVELSSLVDTTQGHL